MKDVQEERFYTYSPEDSDQSFYVTVVKGEPVLLHYHEGEGHIEVSKGTLRALNGVLKEAMKFTEGAQG